MFMFNHNRVSAFLSESPDSLWAPTGLGEQPRAFLHACAASSRCGLEVAAWLLGSDLAGAVVVPDKGSRLGPPACLPLASIALWPLRHFRGIGSTERTVLRAEERVPWCVCRVRGREGPLQGRACAGGPRLLWPPLRGAHDIQCPPPLSHLARGLADLSDG